MTKPLLFIFMIISAQIFAQTTERVKIDGSINVPVNAEAAGITVYNMTSQKGTVTNNNGEFTIAVALNDSLNFSAVQYQPFTVIVDKGVIDTRTLSVTVREAINELEKVIVRPYNLSGNVRVDIQRVDEPFSPDLNAESVVTTNVQFASDRAEVENIAMNDPYVKNGIQFVNIFKAVFNDESEKNSVPETKKDIEVEIRKMYQDDFFKEYIDIEKENIDEFILYAKSHGLSNALLEEGNELDLIEFLIQQGKKFKNQNTGDQ